MLVYNNPGIPFCVNILVVRVRFRYCVIHSYSRYATVNTMIIDRESSIVFLSVTRKRNNRIYESIFAKLDFNEDFTAKGYEASSRNYPQATL